METDRADSASTGPRSGTPGPRRLPRPHGALATATLAAASMCLVAYAVAAVLLLIPVRTPGVQDCGTPGAYLMTGRLDTIPNAQGQILGDGDKVVTLDPDVAREARKTPCRDRVAQRAVPAGILVAAATVVGLVSFLVELTVVRPRARRRQASGDAGTTPDGDEALALSDT